jgi:RimJ/RimL family protein N-acetyltransferase
MPGALYMEGTALSLYTIEEDDLEFLRDIINHPQVRPTLYSRAPINLQQETKHFEESISAETAANLLICVDGERAGTIGLGPFEAGDGNAEIGLFLAPEFWGAGHGTEASRLMTDYAFRERGLHRVYADVLAPNEASARIWQGLGYRHEGTFEEAAILDGERVAIERYAILSREWQP